MRGLVERKQREIMSALEKMKGVKAPELDFITVELSKCGDNSIVGLLLRILIDAWG